MVAALGLAGCGAHPLINYAAVDPAPVPRIVLPPPRPLIAPPPEPPGAITDPYAADPNATDAPQESAPELGTFAAPAEGITAEALASPPPAPQPAPRIAPDPAPADATARNAALLRSNPWVARFWSQLSSAQRDRVSRRLRRGGAEPDAAAAWDRMGLADRVRLLYDAGA